MSPNGSGAPDSGSSGAIPGPQPPDVADLPRSSRVTVDRLAGSDPRS